MKDVFENALYFGRPEKSARDMTWPQFEKNAPELAASFKKWASDLYHALADNDPARAADLEELVKLQKHWIFRPMKGGVIEANPNIILDDVPPVYYDPIADAWIDSSASNAELANIDRLMGKSAVFGYSAETTPEQDPKDIN
jgi:hypothetical protein